ncbi:MAG: cryptochrome/photolyase family protein [Bacteriovoracaceae bacterium]|nr:cryptochrome/photolyase family protein [Bacteriovoracaceae bacterium]
MEGLIILGDQLFPDQVWKPHQSKPIFMAEDFDLCRHYKYHKHKILFFLTSMRRFAHELRSLGYDLDYHELKTLSFVERLNSWIKKRKIRKLYIHEIDDLFFENLIAACAKENGCELIFLKSPKFITTRLDFSGYVEGTKKPFMKTFYEGQRKSLNILMDKKGKPLGGKYSFDTENRKKLPKDISPPTPPQIVETEELNEVKKLVNKHFKDHPGSVENFWLATSRSEAKIWAADFFKHRMENFGIYEDAFSQESDFVFHSVLSPYMNIGFLPPELLMTQIPKLIEKEVSLNSIEGFVRQVIGWREFIFGIYRNYDHIQRESNFFSHKRKLKDVWYTGDTGLLPLDDTIKKVSRLGYCHHIERLMVLSNIMLLSEVHPHEVYRWFMEMFVDSADWVMGPNVWGMGQFSDGGIFATKPYICGSNYIRKMSHYKEGPWCDIMDGLYWKFMEKHEDFFKKNARMGAAMGNLNKMDAERKKRIFKAAQDFVERTTSLDAL